MNRMTFSIVSGAAFNNSEKSSSRFSSMHAGVINFAMGDGSVKGMPVSTDNNIFLSMSGKADGTVFTNVE